METLEFQAEAQQLLHLMVHSIYSNKDIFLRELISNASDALDKLRLEALLDKSLADVDTSDLHVRLDVDREKRELTVSDNGIGMTRDEVVSLIGTIARSGTSEFLRLLKESRDQTASAELIGQFGVGFYSSFMVADRVTLVTRRAGEASGTRWESSGEGTYTLDNLEGAPPGTSVTLHLKAPDVEDGLHDYAEIWKIREIVKRYSDFIAYPIRMEVERTEYDDAGSPKGSVKELQTLNSMKAIWARPQSEVSEDEYREFYKHVSHDWSDPLQTIRMKGEGTFEYEALLFIPSKAPIDLYLREGRRGVQLYVKRVFIVDHCEELMPDYLRFVRGVVDAQDLSLNVSREILQKDRHIQAMRKRLVAKVLSTLREMRDQAEYATFWREFGRVLKEGLYHDPENRDALLELCRFDSTRSATETTDLAGYLERMQPGQDAIYYLTGENRATVENSPHLEAFKAKGYEVLLFSDPVDEIWVSSMGPYREKGFVSAAQGVVDLGTDEEKKQAEETRQERQKEFASLLAWMATKLAEQVKEVRLSSRLTTSPACLVGDAFDVTPNMERLMRSMGQEVPHSKRILEVNPAHPLITHLRDAYAEKTDDAELAEIVELIYGVSVLAEGGELADAARFSRVLADALVKTF